MGNGVTVGIPICSVVVVDEFGRGIRMRGVGRAAVLSEGEKDGVVVTAYGIEDFGGEAPQEVGGGKDDVRGGIAGWAGVAGEGNDVAVEGG